MDELHGAAIQVACMNLVARYALLVDKPEPLAFSELFAPDGVWIRPGARMQGREEIAHFMASRPSRDLTRHVCGSIVVDVVDADHARGSSYATVYGDRDYGGSGTARLVQPEMVVDYRDEYVRIDGRWHIAQRQTIIVFSSKA